MKFHVVCCTVLLFVACATMKAQTIDSASRTSYQHIAGNLTREGLRQCDAYRYLTELTGSVGARLSGSPEAARAVEWGKELMTRLGFQKVHLEPVMVPHWVRGPVEQGTILSPKLSRTKLAVCALGGSIATPAAGVSAELFRVTSFDELKKAGDLAKGKIIFFDRPFDRSKINTFEAYGGAVDQRGQGAIEAAKAGGVAALVRSMTSRRDDVPHTGAMRYADSLQKVPAAAVSTIGADLLDSLLASGAHVRIRLKLSCKTLPDAPSANVVGELTGSEHPEEVIVIGGHLDSWDKGQGAHDDGAGCVQSIEALHLLNEIGVTPKRTIRAVLFINEENGLAGGKAYAALDRPGEKHIAAIETDAGGFTPRGFGIQIDSARYDSFSRWAFLFQPIDADNFQRGGGGADISELGRKGVPTIGLRVDSQRYFDYHHSDNDTIDKVNERELELGAIALATLAYLLGQEGL
jgi:carboxypeptidase Q